jgi:hypothetical protein
MPWKAKETFKFGVIKAVPRYNSKYNGSKTTI